MFFSLFLGIWPFSIFRSFYCWCCLLKLVLLKLLPLVLLIILLLKLLLMLKLLLLLKLNYNILREPGFEPEILRPQTGVLAMSYTHP